MNGKSDERIPVSIMEQYASAAGENATYHFLLLKEADKVQEVIVNWVREQEANF